MKKSILFLCTGNICRSPSADAILRTMAKEQGLSKIKIDSAAIGAWHIGDKPDHRAIHVLKKRGYNEIENIRARQITMDDFYQFNEIIAMDTSHLKFLNEQKPKDAPCAITLFSDYFSNRENQSIADPYYGDINDFETMADEIIKGCEKIIQNIRV